MAELADQFERSVGEVVSGVAAAATQLQITASTMAGSAEESAHQTAEVVKSMDEANAGATASVASINSIFMNRTMIPLFASGFGKPDDGMFSLLRFNNHNGSNIRVNRFYNRTWT